MRTVHTDKSTHSAVSGREESNSNSSSTNGFSMKKSNSLQSTPKIREESSPLTKLSKKKQSHTQQKEEEKYYNSKTTDSVKDSNPLEEVKVGDVEVLDQDVGL